VTFKKGQKVTTVLTGGGQITRESGVVLRVNKQGVFLDNGPGNDPSGPFDPLTGLYRDQWLPGWCYYIEPQGATP
jgi:hypothetical protein